MPYGWRHRPIWGCTRGRGDTREGGANEPEQHFGQQPDRHAGKIDNCQAGVFVGYTSTKGYGLIDRELYMPERWFTDEYAERREKCQVPESLIFKTKNQIGLELIRKALDTELFPVGWVGFDAGFGNDSKFRDAVDSLQVNYLGDIKSNTLVWLNRPKVGISTYCGKGPVARHEKGFRW